MEKHTIKVPKDIRYISDWDNLEEGKRLRDLVPSDRSYIMNKTITGCGYTEYWLNNDQNIILCSPRLVLLENKEAQHIDQENLLYLKNEFDSFEDYDKDISKDSKRGIDSEAERKKEEKRKIKAEEYTKYFKGKIDDHIFNCTFRLKKSTKFMVTYDSFRRVKEALGENIRFYKIIVDEFQSIFCDSRFKSDTENEFMLNLKGLNNVVYLSATPMIDTYLEQLDEYKDLPYYELDWASEKPGRVVKPFLKTKLISENKSITSEVEVIINSYREGRFEKLTRQKEDGSFEEVYSKEAVFYINSVKNLCDIIKKCNLKLEETNVLCSNTDENKKRIKSSFKKVGEIIKDDTSLIGTVPKEGEVHKMFTFCTRTVYLGADFYSTNARSFIFSDANVDCLSVDITLDLPQILGRQRLVENPWKNRAELFYKLNTREITPEEFNEYLEKKKKNTEDLINLYNRAEGSEKHSAAEVYQREAKVWKYKKNFVAVNKHAGSDLQPVFNKLVMISEMRAFDVQQVDYKDRFSVFSSLSKLVDDLDDVNYHLTKLYSFKYLPDKLRYLCSLDESMANSLLPHLPESFNNYYTVLGPDKMKALRFNATDMRKEYEGIMGNQGIDIKTIILDSFVVGERYTKTVVKDKLKKIYDSVGYSKTPKAVDLGDYFIINTCRIQNEKTGKRDAGYLIISKKEDT